MQIVSLNPLDNSANWKCQLCNLKKSAREVLTQDAKLQQELETVDKTTPVALEDFIYRHRVELHETNTHILQAKYALTQLYGNAPGFSMDGKSGIYLFIQGTYNCNSQNSARNLYSARWNFVRNSSSSPNSLMVGGAFLGATC